MRVADSSDQLLPPGREHVGEILIRGHNVMKGYLGRPEATAETLRGGWLHSGDLGYVDEDGFYFIVDRAKDLVIRGGYNVYPREIEEVLYAHPAILEAAVIGKPDERLGEEVVAVAALREGASVSAEEIIAYCRERLAAYKYPREIRFMANCPRAPRARSSRPPCGTDSATRWLHGRVADRDGGWLSWPATLVLCLEPAKTTSPPGKILAVRSGRNRRMASETRLPTAR